MILFERKVEKSQNSEVRISHQFCQAAINSDGNITLRGYSNDREMETMTILNGTETAAIFDLFERLKQSNNLPF